MKQTEVGLIPDDWEVKRLGDNVDILRGGSPRPIENYLTTKADGINWIKIGDVRPNDKYIRKTEEKIIPEGKSRSREVKKGDLILSNSMSFGRPYILAIDGCIHDGWLTIQNYSESFDKEFLYYLLGSDEVFKQYVQMASGSSVQNLNKEKVADLQLKVPPFVEQQRIAKALSDIDALISTTEKLLQKKKNIKQGTMQNLLTGKKRLPGFGDKQTDLFVPNGTHTKEVKNVSPEQIRLSAKMKQTELGEIPEDWEVKSLGEIAETFTGLTYSLENVYEHGTLVLRSSNIKNEQLCFEDNVFVQMSIPERAFVKENDILICVRNGSKALIGKSAIITKAAVGMAFGAFVIVLRSSIINQNYLLYIWQSDFVQKQVTDNLGATINQITNADFKKFNVIISPDKEEQTAIANVLSSMDKEIETLNSKLEKYRNLKTAMMQKLLTGKIRLR